jgi:hypothetical protein
MSPIAKPSVDRSVAPLGTHLAALAGVVDRVTGGRICFAAVSRALRAFFLGDARGDHAVDLGAVALLEAAEHAGHGFGAELDE